MPKPVCRANLYNKIVQLEVCRICSGRGMGINGTAHILYTLLYSTMIYATILIVSYTLYYVILHYTISRTASRQVHVKPFAFQTAILTKSQIFRVSDGKARIFDLRDRKVEESSNLRSSTPKIGESPITKEIKRQLDEVVSLKARLYIIYVFTHSFYVLL